MLDRRHCATRLGRSPWDCPMPEAILPLVGVRSAHLQALIDHGHIERRASPPGPGETPPGQDPDTGPCLVLADSGVALARALDVLPGVRGPRGVKPRWDASTRRLHLGAVLVKRFTRSAPNQECLLAA